LRAKTRATEGGLGIRRRDHQGFEHGTISDLAHRACRLNMPRDLRDDGSSYEIRRFANV